MPTYQKVASPKARFKSWPMLARGVANNSRSSACKIGLDTLNDAHSRFFEPAKFAAPTNEIGLIKAQPIALAARRSVTIEVASAPNRSTGKRDRIRATR